MRSTLGSNSLVRRHSCPCPPPPDTRTNTSQNFCYWSITQTILLENKTKQNNKTCFPGQLSLSVLPEVVQGSQLVSRASATRGRQCHGRERPAAPVGHQHQHPQLPARERFAEFGDGGGIIIYDFIILGAEGRGNFWISSSPWLTIYSQTKLRFPYERKKWSEGSKWKPFLLTLKSTELDYFNFSNARGWSITRGPGPKEVVEVQAPHKRFCLCQAGPLLRMARGEDGQVKGRTENPTRAADEKLFWQISPCISQPCSFAWIPGTEATSPMVFFGSFVASSLSSLNSFR